MYKLIKSAINIEVEMTRESLSTFTYYEEYDDLGYPQWIPIIYVCTPEVQFHCKHLELRFKDALDVIISHERGHALSQLRGNNLSPIEEEIAAWDYAEEHFFDGDINAFNALKDKALQSYIDPDGFAGYIAAMFEYFKARGIEDILFEE